MRLALLVFLLIALSVQAAESPRLAIVAGAGTQPEADLLTVELSRQPVVLLERTEIERVLAEQRLSAVALDGDRVRQFGQVLGADGVLYLNTEKNVLSARLVAVHPGVIAGAWQQSTPLPDPAAWSREAAASVATLLPKLAVAREAAIPISVVNLRATRSRPEAAALESDLALLLIHRLAHEPAFFVLERQQMEALASEPRAEPAAFWTGRYLVDGAIEQSLTDPDQLTIRLRLQPPGRTALPVVHTCRRDALPAAADALTREIARLLQREPAAAKWDAAREAEQFWHDAQWAFRNELYARAATAAESSAALGRRDAETLALRIRAELLAARPKELVPLRKLETMVRECLNERNGDWRIELENMHGERTLDVLRKIYREMPESQREERLHRALRGVELARDQAGLLTADRSLTHQALLIGCALLEWFADNRDGAYDDGMHALQSALRELAAEPAREASAASEAEFWLEKVAFTPLLARAPAETIAIYRAALARHFGGDADRALRVAIAHSQDRYPSLVVERSAQSPDAAAIWKELLDQLEASSFAGDRLLGAFGRTPPTILQSYFEPLDPALGEAFWRERARFASGELSYFYTTFLRLPSPGRVRRASDKVEIDPRETAKFELAQKLLRYLLAESTPIDPWAFQGLYHPEVYTEEEARAMYAAILAHEPRARAAVGDQPFLRQIRERGQELLLRFPQLAGTPENPAALKVTRYWHPYRLPEFRDGARMAARTWFAGYSEHRLWLTASMQRREFFQRSDPLEPSFLLAVDLQTFATEVIPIPPRPPPPRDPGKVMWGGTTCTISPAALFVSHDDWLARYDRADRTWHDYPELTDVWTHPLLIGERLYVRMNHSPDGARARQMGEMLELNLATDERTVVVNDRRYPPESPIDAWPQCDLTACAAPGGRIYFRGYEFNLGRPRVRFAAYDPAARAWAPLEETEWRHAAGEEAGWQVVERGNGHDLPSLKMGDRRLEFRCALSEEDRTLLKMNGPYPPLDEIAAAIPFEYNFRTTPDGVVFHTGGGQPGFWFVPKEDLPPATAATP